MCFYPRKAIKLVHSFTKKGKNPLKFIDEKTAISLRGNPNLVEGLPCGQCTNCRLNRSREWAIRCMDEASLHKDNCFITLTFDDQNLSKRDRPMSLDKTELQKFFKRMRKHYVYQYYDTKLKRFLPRFARRFLLRYASKKVAKIRYYACGEYGEKYKRPHYHAILFGIDFPDKKLEKIEDGKHYYSSELLRKFWPFGNNIITDVTFDSCAYVARYIMKKALGPNAWKNYFEYMDEQTGELIGQREPEYTTMSRRPGIGKGWLDKYLRDVYPKDKKFVRDRGYMKPPKFYDTQYEIVNPSDYSRIKQARIDEALKRADPDPLQRLVAKQKIKLQRISVLKRNLE